MKKENQGKDVSIVVGICLGIALNVGLFIDISFFGLYSQPSLLGFIWNLGNYLGQPVIGPVAIFMVVQLSLVALLSVFLSAYLAAERKIVPPSLVLLGSILPLSIVFWTFFAEAPHITTNQPMTSAYLPAFLLTFLYFIEAYFMGPFLDWIVKGIVGAHCEEKQIEGSAITFSSGLQFGVLMQMMNDRKWLRDYPSLQRIGSPHKDEERGEASFRLNKIGTNNYMCLSIFRLPKKVSVIFTFYELNEDRFGTEQRVSEETVEILQPQMGLLKEHLKLTQVENEYGTIKKALGFTESVRVRLLERIIPYRLHISVSLLNALVLGILVYESSLKAIPLADAMMIYSLLLLVSIEFLRRKPKKE
jgi:hypothetical protein